MIPVGAEMTQMEHRFVPSRFKDGYGPIGMWFQYFKARATNAYGEDYTVTRESELRKYEPYGSAVPTPTPLRNHQMFLDIQAGKSPIYIRTDEAIANLTKGDAARLEEVKGEAWEDFLDMTISQAFDVGRPEHCPGGYAVGDRGAGALHHGVTLRRSGGMGQRPRRPGSVRS